MSLCKNVSRKCVRFAVLITLLAASALAAHAQVVFSPPKNISNSSANTQAHEIAVDSSGNINVVWSDNSSGAYAVLFSRSTDGGATFSTPVNVSSHPGSTATGARMALDAAGNIYIGWTDNSPGHYAAFFSRSVDGGATFSSPLLISIPGATGGFDQVAVDSAGNVNVVSEDNSTGFSSVFFSRSTDGGGSFSSPANLSNRPPGFSPPNSFAGTMAVDSQGNIYVAWFSTALSGTPDIPGIFFSSSSDGGATFSAIKVLGSPLVFAFHDSLQVAANSPSNVSVAWGTDESTPDFTAASYSLVRSSDGGATFGPGAFAGGCRPASGYAYIPMLPNMALDSLGGGNILSHNSCAGSVDFARYVGASITASTSWSTSGSNQAAKALAVDSSNNIDVVFAGGTSGTPGPGFWFTESRDQGATFSLTQPISLSTTISNPEIATGGGNIYVVWEQTDSSGNANIFFSRGTALSLASVSLSSASVAGGTSLTGTVTLGAPAPTGGAVVSLSSSDASVSVPGSVTVAEGATSATFAVTTNAVSATTNVTISASFNGATQTAGVTVRLVYNFSGYLPPLLNDGLSLFHSGRTVPVKFQLTMPDGSMVTNALANVEVFQIQNTPTGTADQDMSVAASGSSSSGTAFRFDPTSNQYIYNLNTSGYASGTYLLRTTISDGSTHDVQFSIH